MTIREERVQEISDKLYLTLKETYQTVLELKGMVDRLHDSGLQQETRVTYDQVAAIKLTMDRLYTDLERFMRPECDPDSAVDYAMTENPGK